MKRCRWSGGGKDEQSLYRKGITLTLALSHRGRGDWTPASDFRGGLGVTLRKGVVGHFG